MSSGEGEDTSKEAADIAAFFKSGKWRRRGVRGSVFLCVMMNPLI